MAKSRYVDITSIMQVIGCVYKKPQLLDLTDKYNITEFDFTEEFHKILFGTIYKLHESGMETISLTNIEDFLAISASFFRASENQLFMLKVYGESMVEIGINDGDYVVAKKQDVAENGDVVVAMIDGRATVKTFYRERTRIRLQPENCTYPPIYSDNVQIAGKVVGCIRRM